jgi:uncharacterized protein
MVSIGKINTLSVVKILDFGAYLDGGERGEILLPRRYMPETCKEGDSIKVFIYFDSEDRIIATTEKPLAMVDDIALLKVIDVTHAGAFLEWGLLKDLLVPLREQKDKMELGKKYLVKLFHDKETDRIAGSARLDLYLDNTIPSYEEGQKVDLIIGPQTILGFKAIVNLEHWGMLFKNEVFQPLQLGQKTKGYIKKVREDDKIDLSLHPPGYKKIGGMADQLLEKLEDEGGFLPLTDKSDPGDIYNTLLISKKAFKIAVGNLYKKGYILLEKDGIRINPAIQGE